MSLILALASAASMPEPIVCPVTAMEECTAEQVNSYLHATPKWIARKDEACLYETDAHCTIMASGTVQAPNGARIAWQKVELSGPFPLTQMVMLFDIDQEAVSFIGQAQTEGFFGSPELKQDNDGQLLLHVPGVMAGTGSGNGDLLFAYDDKGNWRQIDIESWKETVELKLPDGFGIWKGVRYQFESMFAWSPVWRDTDGNCCATGGDAYMDFAIDGDRLVLTDLTFEETLPIDKVPSPAPFGLTPLQCPIEKAVYENPEQTEWQLVFTKPEHRPSAASDLLLSVTGIDFVMDFAFTASQGFGGTYLLTTSHDEETDQSFPASEEDQPGNIAFYGLNPGKHGGLLPMEDPPQSDEAAPAAIFIPDVSRHFWYDAKYVDSETGETLHDPVDIDQAMFFVKCLSY